MQFITPTWPAPKNIFAYSTTRQQGTSHHPYSSFNLALHVGDEPNQVMNNRRLLAERLKLPSEPIWLNQVHSNKVITIDRVKIDTQADASVTRLPDTVCAVMTADCLPILICNRSGTLVAAIHAGWRGLASGIIENTLDTMTASPSDLMAWLGPAIGPDVFEVSADVVDTFTTYDKQAINAFRSKPETKDKWLANIYLLATQRLNSLGLTAIYGGSHCTFSDPKNFYSYRRDLGITGRMATLIWLSA